jgi:hypothetical protein
VDDFWAAHPKLDRCRPRKVPGEHRCLWCCEPKPKVRQQTKAETAARLLPAGPVLYGKGSIFGSAAGLKRHQRDVVQLVLPDTLLQQDDMPRRILYPS